MFPDPIETHRKGHYSNGLYEAKMLSPSITVEARQYEINSQIGKNYATKTDDRENGEPLSPPAPDHPGVEQGSVNEPCNKGPGLLRIPSPISPPGRVGPDSPCNNAEAKEYKPYGDHLIVEII